MLSSTSLLHGNCIFNRNNTVATQQGMKTYWLCKSYRITMCRARCITHQGRVISATGVHNHSPHMKNPTSEENCGNSSLQPSQAPPQPIIITSSVAATPTTSAAQTIRLISQNIPTSTNIPSSTGMIQHQVNSVAHILPMHPQQVALPPPPQLPPPPVNVSQVQSHSQQISSHNIVGPQTISATPVVVQQPTNNQPQPTTVIQNMMQNVLNPNNLMHQHHLATSIHGLTNIGPIINPHQHQHHVLTNIHPPPSLQITPVINAHIQSPVRTLHIPEGPPNQSPTPSSGVLVQTNSTLSVASSGLHQQNEENNQPNENPQNGGDSQMPSPHSNQHSFKMEHL